MFKLCATMQTKINKKTYSSMRKDTALAVNSIKPGDFPTGPEVWLKKHPQFDERMAKYRQTLIDTKDEKHDTISFGDSLMDGWTKKKFTAVAEDRNFNIGGSWCNHMEDVFRVIIPLMEKNNIRCNNIIIGCLGGNPLLAQQPIDDTIRYSLQTLTDLRSMVNTPAIRIIVYGIPPTVSKYVTKHAPKFEAAMYNWVINDINSVFLPLQKKFTKWLIIPKAIMNADGVHFTPSGIYEFDALLNKAKTGYPKRIVD